MLLGVTLYELVWGPAFLSRLELLGFEVGSVPLLVVTLFTLETANLLLLAVGSLEDGTLWGSFFLCGIPSVSLSAVSLSRLYAESKRSTRKMTNCRKISEQTMVDSPSHCVDTKNWSSLRPYNQNTVLYLAILTDLTLSQLEWNRMSSSFLPYIVPSLLILSLASTKLFCIFSCSLLALSHSSPVIASREAMEYICKSQAPGTMQLLKSL